VQRANGSERDSAGAAVGATGELGIPVSGSLGVLEYAVEVGRITAEEAVGILRGQRN